MRLNETDPDFYVAGGTLSVQSPSYVERVADTQLFHALQSGDFCYVLNTRQMGKSSLMVRTVTRLKNENHAVGLVLDLTALGQNTAPEPWYWGLLTLLGEQAARHIHPSVEMQLEDFWHENASLDLTFRFFEAIRRVVLPALPASLRLVVFMDEIDAVLSLPFNTDEFFSALRQCYNRRAYDPSLKKLTFCLLGVATPSDLVTDVRASPFNIGRRIRLGDFSGKEAQVLSHGLKGRNARALLQRVLFWTGGHPYLTQKLCRALADMSESGDVTGASEQAANAPLLSLAIVDRVCMDLFLSGSARLSDDNLAFVRNRLLLWQSDGSIEPESEIGGNDHGTRTHHGDHHVPLLLLYQAVQHGAPPVRNDETNPLCAALYLSGVCRVDGEYLRVRNRVYERVFNASWVAAHLPGGELRRQKESFRRGATRAALAGGAVSGALFLLAAYALRERGAANRARDAQREQAAQAQQQAQQAEKQLYFANVNLLQSAWENGTMQVVERLLRETQASRWRGWEWGYWNRQVKHGEQFWLTGHADVVQAAVFSPDGVQIATCSDDRTVRLWDGRTGKLIRVLESHTDQVWGVAFSPQNARLYTTASGSIWVWNTQTGQLLHKWPGFGERSIGVSRNGERLLVTRQSCISLLDSQTGQPVLTFPAPPTAPKARAFYAAYSPDNLFIVSGENDGSVRIWDARTGELVRLLGTHPARVWQVAFSPDGKRVVSSGYDGTARVWDTQNGGEVVVLRGHTGVVWHAAFSPDGTQIATGSLDTTVRIWDARTGKLVDTLRSHRARVLSVAYSPDSRHILTASEDKRAKMWNAKREQERVINEPFAFWLGSRVVTCVKAFLPETLGRNTSRLKPPVGPFSVWNPATGHREAIFEPSSFTQTSPYILCANKTQALFQTEDDRVVYTPLFASDKGENDADVWEGMAASDICAAIFTPNGKQVLVSCYSRPTEIVVRNARTGRREGVLSSPALREAFAARPAASASPFTVLSLSPDGLWAAAATNHDTPKRDEPSWVHLWNRATGKEIVLENPLWVAAVLVFSPDNRRLIMCGNAGGASLWEINRDGGRCTAIMEGHTADIQTGVWSPDGRRVLTAGFDNTARVWDAELGRETLVLRGHDYWVTQAFWTQDGKAIVTGSLDGTVRLWQSE